jgi:hypothetical protein
LSRFGAVALVAGLAVPATAHAVAPARVQGSFAMQARVTGAVGLRGERRGEHLTRMWRIAPRGCDHDVCDTLRLQRTLAGGRVNRVILSRRHDGSYVGHGAFFVGLRCRGRTYRHGSRAPFTIRLSVTATRTVGGVRFARRVAAGYVNPSRTDATPCSVGPVHDAARYSGRLRSGTPSAPRPAFTSQVVAGTELQFADASTPGTGRGERLTHWHWSFGDAASGAAELATGPVPAHIFSAPGSYPVTLTVTDHAGLSATLTRRIAVP